MAVKIFLTIVLSIFALGWVAVSAENSKPTSQSSDPLSIRWTIDRSEFLLGEPIVAEMILSNPSYEAVSWSGVFGLGRDVSFEAIDMSGRSKRWEGKNSIGMFKSAPSLLVSGGEIRNPVLMDRYVLADLFPQPGRYQLKLDFSYKVYEGDSSRSSRLSSNTLEIEVKAPAGLDREALDFINGPLDAALKQASNDVIAQRQQEFVDRFSNSVYAKFVIFQLANTYHALGDTRKAAREICKLAGQEFFYKKTVERKTFELEAKIRPYIVPAGLAEDAPIPERPHPCLRMLN